MINIGIFFRNPKFILIIINVSLMIFVFSCAPKLAETTAGPENLKSYKINTVAFYNLENLFDTIDNPRKFDESSPIMSLDSGQRGKVYWRKNRNMARVIAQIGVEKARNAPAVIGVAEVENRNVLEDLINDAYLKDKKYEIIHYDSPDLRGIDVALLYQKKLFYPFASAAHEVVIFDYNSPGKRQFTRDVLLVSGILETDTLHILVNHWPSRYGGEKISRKNRETAAAVNKKITDSLLAVNPYAKIIIMGDMNDGPYNSSVKNILQAKANPEKTPDDGLYNPMENMFKKQGLGTIAYKDSWDIFDQIIISKSLLKKDFDSYRFYQAHIYNPDFLVNQEGRWKGYPFRSYADGGFTGGYSDHFPVYIYLIKAAKP